MSFAGSAVEHLSAIPVFPVNFVDFAVIEGTFVGPNSSNPRSGALQLSQPLCQSPSN